MRKSASVLFLGYAILCTAVQTTAGPVPGVDSITKFPVEFSTPESLDVSLTDEGDYLVTFIYQAEGSPESVSVAGTFNYWDMGDLPMTLGSDGVYRVTARIGEGIHQYKFVVDGSEWISDPKNPQMVGDQNNSVLRLGLPALIGETQVERGDGNMERRGFLHNPDEFMFYDVYSESDAIIRFRAVRGDLEDVDILLLDRLGEAHPQTMTFVASDEIFDYWEFHADLKEDHGFEPIGYRFRAHDGDESLDTKTSFPLIFNQDRLVHTPEWAKDAIWYQIMVDRFRDGEPSNNPEFVDGIYRKRVTHLWRSDWYEEQPYEREGGATFWEWSMYERLYGGDLQGVEEKLDYLKELGVTAIYFNPIFQANNSHKYNARSFTHVDDGYGVAGEFEKSLAEEDFLDSSTWKMNQSDQVFLDFLETAKSKGFRVILDGVFNHLGDTAIPFLDVKENLQQSRYADWYTIHSWEPFEYEGWAGFDGLPEFDKTETGLVSESLTKYIYDVTERWMDPNGDGDPSDGIDGWRLDVPMELPREFWREWRVFVKDINPDAYIVGEIWDPAEHWLDGTSFDAVMNYQFAMAAFEFFGNREEKISATEFDQKLGRLRLRYPREHTYAMQNLYDSHDTDRWVSRLMNPDMDYDEGNRIQDNNPDYFDERPDEEAYERMKLMAIMQAGYIGAPMIWYGTEVGMYGADDPMCRMPMWWEDMMPYDNPDYFIRDDIFEHFQRLFELRKELVQLRRGDYKTVLAENEKDVFGFARYYHGERDHILVVMNNSSEDQTVSLPGYRDFESLMGAEVASAGALTLGPISGAIIKARPE